MTKSANLGFPRIGADRELKKTVEAFWKGNVSETELLATAAELRKIHWMLQKDAGIDYIPSNDFSLYDQMLDTTAMLGAIPERYGFSGGSVDLATYFAMARGNSDVHAMEMTKWFDTNYHYIVPEFEAGQEFSLSSTKVIDEYNEAKALGVETRPVLIGPITYLALGKAKAEGFDPLDLANKVVAVYVELLDKLKAAGAEWVQIDEPVLALDVSDKLTTVFRATYNEILGLEQRPNICLATYFNDVSEHFPLLSRLGFEAVHLDLVRGAEQLAAAIEEFPTSTKLSLGLINGRNIWKANIPEILHRFAGAIENIGLDRIIVAPSCSLLHSPVDLGREQKLEDNVKARLAFATQKLDEIKLLADAVSDSDSVKDKLDAIIEVFEGKGALQVTDPAVSKRVSEVTKDMFNRKSEFTGRKKAQTEALKLPVLPTTTIGSFPQTPEIRKARAEFKKGTIDKAAYVEQMKQEIKTVVEFQDKIGLDVLVHGEAERNDMVEYFGQQLNGFAFTQFGWVQSYGSRCVKPPIIYGDVSRSAPMTVEWAEYAQSLSKSYVKGMLTGPLTIMKWSFVREDQPADVTANQIALAIRDEVADLEDAGISIIQIDEPAFREGMPLRKGDWQEYFSWAVDAFKLSACVVKDETQIHTHMCYSDFNEIIEAIAALDADVISIEASRSDIELLDVFQEFDYPNEIGPGVYDIHSPRVPPVEEMTDLLRKMLKVIPAELLWVNPDCGLKTRGWPETEAALVNMVEAAKILRAEL